MLGPTHSSKELGPAPRPAHSSEEIPTARGIDPATIGQAILASGMLAVVGMDSAGRIVTWSDTAQAMFGHDRADVLGRDLASVLVPPALRTAHREGLRRYLASGESNVLGRAVAQTAIRADGTEFPVELWAMAVGHGRDAAFLALAQDMTERREAEFELAKSRALLAAAETVARAGSFEHDLRTGQGTWSSGLYRLLGQHPVDEPRRPMDALAAVHPDDREAACRALCEAVAEGRRRLRRELRILRTDGEERSAELMAQVVPDDDGQAERLVGTVRDITDELRAGRDRELLARMIDSSDDAILTKGSDGTITSWNRGAELLYGYSAEETVGQNVSMLAPPDRHEEQRQLTARVFGGEVIQRVETERVRRDGERAWVSLNMTPIRDSSGQIVSVAVLARDVTEPRRQREQLQYLASHDLLTGLYNRGRFEEELTRELSRAARGGHAGAILTIDIDGFRAINESVGHAAGDSALRQIAHLLSCHVGTGDVLGRIGGDEFAVLLPDVTPEQAREVAEQLLEAVRTGTPSERAVTVSIGAVVFAPSRKPVLAEEVLVSADLALARAKAQGQDRVVLFDDDQAKIARAGAHRSWSERIRHALAHDRFELCWQPILEVASGEVSHGELLLRMIENGETIAPGEFIPAAERFGLIHLIDRWVVQRAFELIASGHPAAARPLSVNLSAETVAGDPGILRFIEHELRRTGADPGRCIFEVTETAAIASLHEAGAFAWAVRELGFRVAIDDFGTGFSSLQHLKHLPVDYIKIDRVFIHELPASDIDQRLVGSIVNLAATLQARTVAEAVQDEATMGHLRALGVDYAQGYHLGGPQPI